MCSELDRGARGLCRAAIRSGCEVGGRHEDSRRCSKLASKFRQRTGLEPVWLETPVVVEEEAAPVVETAPVVEPPPEEPLA